MKKPKQQKITQLEIEKKIRRFWEINPRTRVKRSKKKYKRARESQKLKNKDF